MLGGLAVEPETSSTQLASTFLKKQTKAQNRALISVAQEASFREVASKPVCNDIEHNNSSDHINAAFDILEKERANAVEPESDIKDALLEIETVAYYGISFAQQSRYARLLKYGKIT